jgi:phospholipase/carboxylesterase
MYNLICFQGGSTLSKGYFIIGFKMDQPIYTAKLRDVVMKIRNPEGEGPHPVLFLLHGWTGDENVMWIIASRLPANYLMISPRGLYKSPLGGYAWHRHRSKHWPTVEEFYPAVEMLVDLQRVGNGLQGALADVDHDNGYSQEAIARSDFSSVSLVGFSQGAALAYSFALLYPERVHLLGGLAGFMPEEVDKLVARQSLGGKKVFITHGTQDEIVPVEKARRSVELMQQAGSEVMYCEQEAGHKLSASCFRALESFFAAHS